MVTLTDRVSQRGGTVTTTVESGDPDCPVTMYCRVRVSVEQNGVKLTEATATGISKGHAESRAAFKIVEVIKSTIRALLVKISRSPSIMVNQPLLSLQKEK